jgi:hypothetical protein
MDSILSIILITIMSNIDLKNFEFFSLTTNTTDSVYPRVAAFGNNVYVVWQQLVSPIAYGINGNSSNSVANEPNYDIFIKKSSDDGITFDKGVNLSNSSGFSEHPHLAVYGNNVYVAWIDNNTFTNYKKEILFRKSNDGGKTFSDIIHLHRFDNTNHNDVAFGNSSNPEISAFGNNVYVVWNEEPSNYGNDRNDTNPFVYRILFRASIDGGSTFKNIKTLSANATYFSYPKIASSSTNNGSNVYVVWNIGFPIDDAYKNVEGIFFKKSNDNGDIFSNLAKISGPIKSIGRPQIFSYQSSVYVIWGGIPDFRIGGNVFYAKSAGSGHSFTNPVSLNNNRSSNVEVAANKDKVYVLWEEIDSQTNDDIFIKTSNDGGQTFTKHAINLSNNPSLSECPSIALSDNNGVYLVWEDATQYSHEIFFMRGHS